MEQGFDTSVAYALSCLRRGDLQLKGKQLEAMKSIYEGRDVFVWLPTGYGKSICYHSLPFLLDHKLGRVSLPLNKRSVCLVISPLLSLMVNQVSSLREFGIGAAILSSNKGIDSSLLSTSKGIQSGAYRLLFSAPEAIMDSECWREILLEEPLCHQVVAVVVDEAHCVYKWSKDFRPAYSRLHELRALVPSGVPMMALTATITKFMLASVKVELNMPECRLVCLSPDRPNIYYEVKERTSIEADFDGIIEDLLQNSIKTKRVLVYCQSLNMCSSLYAYFLYTQGDKSYYPPNAEKIASNRLFGMYHSGTNDHIKDIVMKSLADPCGKIRVVFATVALGMGVNLADVNRVVHYGAPHSLEDYFQESGRGGRTGDQAYSTIYWCCKDAPKYKDLADHRKHEVVVVRSYLENCSVCRRKQLLEYFVEDLTYGGDITLCCDVCNKRKAD